MADHLGSYLDELVSERLQGPLFYRLGQYQTSQEIAEIVSQGEQVLEYDKWFRIGFIKYHISSKNKNCG